MANVSVPLEAAAESIADWLQPPSVWAHDENEPNIIYTNDAWTLHVHWETRGPGNFLIVGNFHLHAYLERMGPDTGANGGDQDVIDLGDLNIPTKNTLPVEFYDVHLDVPPTRIPAGPPHSGRIYKPVVTMTFTNCAGRTGPVAAYAEGPMLQFFNPT